MKATLKNLPKPSLLVQIVKNLIKYTRSSAFNLMGEDSHSKISTVSVEDKDVTSTLAKYQFGHDEVIRVNAEPSTNDQVRREFRRRVGEFFIPAPIVSTFKNVELVGSYATGFDDQGRLIRETTLPKFYDLTDAISLRTLLLKKKNHIFKNQLNHKLKINCAVSLLNPWHHNYFHWFLDCLTKLEGVEHFKQVSNSKPKVIISRKATKWQLESLQLLGYEKSDLVFWLTSNAYVEELIVPSFRRISSAGISPSACHFVKEKILSSVAYELKENACQFSSKIIISRKNASRRRILNEEEVIEHLKPLGFVSYALENMSISEQADLFSRAEMIVGPHGAGMTNILFSKNVTLIELFSGDSNYLQPVFFSLSQALGFKYGYVVGEKVGRGSTSRTGDIKVNIKKLIDLINQLS